MKRLVYSAKRPEQPEANKRQSTKNVTRVCEAMNWNRPTFIDKTANGHRCKWGHFSFLFDYITDESQKILCREYGLDPSILDNSKHYGVEEALADKLGIEWNDFYGSDLGKEIGTRYGELLDDPKVINQARNAAEDELAEVYEKTGINCFLNRGGFLIVPFAED